MSAESATIWIAERHFDAGDEVESIRALIAHPVREPSGEWGCRVEVVGGGFSFHEAAFGEDSLQALLMGIAMLRAVLVPTMDRIDLRWLGTRDLGIEIVG